MKNLVWIASYPRSGNTWFRSFLSNLRREADKPVDINDLDKTIIASNRQLLDNELGYDSDTLDQQELQRLRPQLFRHLATQSSEVRFHKVHDACGVTVEGQPIFPPEATRMAIYLIRNPLDLCVSLAHFMGRQDYDNAIQKMGDTSSALGASESKYEAQLNQRLGTWSEHVSSWVDNQWITTHVFRYEDMHLSPQTTFTKMAEILGYKANRERIDRAIANSSFSVLKEQETANGFQERPPRAAQFFRQGKVGSWRTVLTDSQVSQLIIDHRETMRRFGYLDNSDTPVY